MESGQQKGKSVVWALCERWKSTRKLAPMSRYNKRVPEAGTSVCSWSFMQTAQEGSARTTHGFAGVKAAAGRGRGRRGRRRQVGTRQGKGKGSGQVGLAGTARRESPTVSSGRTTPEGDKGHTSPSHPLRRFCTPLIRVFVHQPIITRNITQSTRTEERLIQPPQPCPPHFLHNSFSHAYALLPRRCLTSVWPSDVYI